MNRDEAQKILSIYRPGTADEEDPQVAEALEVARQDPDLARWLGEHSARQMMLRERFRQIAVPAGLKEQILYEHAAQSKVVFWQPRFILAAAAVLAAMVVVTVFWFRPRETDDTFAVYRSRMVRVALRGYAMDLATNDPVRIRAYLASNGAPTDYVLPGPLRKAAMIGCAIEQWQGAKVSMICFRTGRPLSPGEQSDVWLFVVERSAVKNAPAQRKAQITSVNRLVTATWTQDDMLYLLGTPGDEQAIRRFL